MPVEGFDARSLLQRQGGPGSQPLLPGGMPSDLDLISRTHIRVSRVHTPQGIRVFARPIAVDEVAVRCLAELLWSDNQHELFH